MYENEISLPVMRQHPSIGEPPYETLPTDCECEVCTQRKEDYHLNECLDADRPCDSCLTRNLPTFDGE